MTVSCPSTFHNVRSSDAMTKVEDLANPAPDPPVLTDRSSTWINLKWDQRYGNGGAARFSLEWDRGLGAAHAFSTVYEGGLTWHGINKLMPSTKYRFRVKMSHAIGDGKYSPMVEVRTKDAEPSVASSPNAKVAAIDSLTGSFMMPPTLCATSSSSLRVAWRPLPASQSQLVKSYRVEVQSARQAVEPWVLQYEGMSLTCEIAGLNRDSPYRVRVAATGYKADFSSWSDPLFTCTSAYGGVAIGDKVEVPWAGVIKGDAEEQEEVKQDFPAHVVEIRGDKAWVHYEGWDSCYDEWIVLGKLKDMSVPSASGRPMLDAGPVPGELLATWTPPESQGGTNITSYRAYLVPVGGSMGRDFRDGVTVPLSGGCQYLFTGLSFNTPYTCRVIAVNSQGEGPPSRDSEGAFTKSTRSPGPPSGLALTQVTAHSMKLEWVHAADDGGSPIVCHCVYFKEGSNPYPQRGIQVVDTSEGGLDEAGGGGSGTLSGGKMSLQINSLTPGTAIKFKVVAMNASGEGQPGPILLGRTISLPGGQTLQSLGRSAAEQALIDGAAEDPLQDDTSQFGAKKKREREDAAAAARGGAGAGGGGGSNGSGMNNRGGGRGGVGGSQQPDEFAGGCTNDSVKIHSIRSDRSAFAVEERFDTAYGAGAAFPQDDAVFVWEKSKMEVLRLTRFKDVFNKATAKKENADGRAAGLLKELRLMRYCGSHPNMVHLLHIGCPPPAVQDWIDQPRTAVTLASILANSDRGPQKNLLGGNPNQSFLGAGGGLGRGAHVTNASSGLTAGTGAESVNPNDAACHYAFRPEEVRLIMYQLCEAVNFLHAAGCVHTDINEANILVLPGEQMNVKLSGLSKACRADYVYGSNLAGRDSKKAVMKEYREYIPDCTRAADPPEAHLGFGVIDIPAGVKPGPGMPVDTIKTAELHTDMWALGMLFGRLILGKRIPILPPVRTQIAVKSTPAARRLMPPLKESLVSKPVAIKLSKGIPTSERGVFHIVYLQHVFETLGTPHEMELMSLPNKAAREYFTSIARVETELDKDLNDIYSKHRELAQQHARDDADAAARSGGDAPDVLSITPLAAASPTRSTWIQRQYALVPDHRPVDGNAREVLHGLLAFDSRYRMTSGQALASSYLSVAKVLKTEIVTSTQSTAHSPDGLGASKIAAQAAAGGVGGTAGVGSHGGLNTGSGSLQQPFRFPTPAEQSHALQFLYNEAKDFSPAQLRIWEEARPTGYKDLRPQDEPAAKDSAMAKLKASQAQRGVGPGGSAADRALTPEEEFRAIQQDEKRAADKDKSIKSLSTSVQMLLMTDHKTLDARDFLRRVAILIRMPDSQVQLEGTAEAAAGSSTPGTLLAFRILPNLDGSDSTGASSRRAAQELQRLVKADAVAISTGGAPAAAAAPPPPVSASDPSSSDPSAAGPPSGGAVTSGGAGAPIKIFGVNAINPPDAREVMVYSPYGSGVMRAEQLRLEELSKKAEEDLHVDTSMPPRIATVRCVTRTPRSLSLEWRSPKPHGQWARDIVLSCSYEVRLAVVPEDMVASLLAALPDRQADKPEPDTLAVNLDAIDEMALEQLPYEVVYAGLLNWTSIADLEPKTYYIANVRPVYSLDMGVADPTETKIFMTKPVFDAVDLPLALATPEPPPFIVDQPPPAPPPPSFNDPPPTSDPADDPQPTSQDEIAEDQAKIDAAKLAQSGQPAPAPNSGATGDRPADPAGDTPADDQPADPTDPAGGDDPSNPGPGTG